LPSQIQPLYRTQFRQLFGTDASNVGRINFRQSGASLELAQLAAVAAITIIYQDSPWQPMSDLIGSGTSAARPLVVLRPQPPMAVDPTTTAANEPRVPPVTEAAHPVVGGVRRTVRPAMGELIPRASVNPTLSMAEPPLPNVMGPAASPVVSSDASDSNSNMSEDAFDGFDNETDSGDDDNDDIDTDASSSAFNVSGEQSTVPDSTKFEVSVCEQDLSPPELYAELSVDERDFDGITPPSSPPERP